MFALLNLRIRVLVAVAQLLRDPGGIVPVLPCCRGCPLCASESFRIFLMSDQLSLTLGSMGRSIFASGGGFE